MWIQANVLFKYPVIHNEKHIISTLKDSWELAGQVSRGKASAKQKDKLETGLDKLSDILSCKCQISLCSENACTPDCKKKVHYACKCPKEQKIPHKELQYIYGQRIKVGTIGPHQMGPDDKQEQKRQNKAEQRRAKEQEKEERYLSSAAKENSFQVEVSEDDTSSIGSTESFNQNTTQPSPSHLDQTLNERNYADISNIALASIRYGTGLRETAAIATAAWIDGGLISKSNTRLVIDHNKVKRAQEKLMKSLSLEFDEECRTEKISCILLMEERI